MPARARGQRHLRTREPAESRPTYPTIVHVAGPLSPNKCQWGTNHACAHGTERRSTSSQLCIKRTFFIGGDSSISGGKTVKCGEDGPRPPLDQEKFRLFEEIIHEKFPSFTRKEFREKILNIQKVERKIIAPNSQL